MNSVRVNRSPNIALFPALLRAGDGTYLCSWYEYGSPDSPTRSDVWFARSSDGKQWSDPVNVSAGVSYNNGPSLAELLNGTLMIAWHSHRPPGKEPFSKDGDVTHLWYSRSNDGGATWENPELCHPSLERTEYASLAVDGDGVVWMSFNVVGESGWYISSLNADRGKWTEPIACCFENTSGPTCLEFDENGTMLVIGKNKENIVIVRVDPQCADRCERAFDLQAGSSRGHPKLSLIDAGTFAVTMHERRWGVFEYTYQILSIEDHLVIELATDSSVGNSSWAVSAAELACENGGKESVRTFSFGPDYADLGNAVTPVEGDVIYNSELGYGFLEPVEQSLRQLGEPLDRSVVHGKTPAHFRVDTAAGNYSIKVHVWSWIATRPGAEVSFGDATVLSQSLELPEHDSCRVLDIASGEVRIYNSPLGDCNRPSKLVGGALAWTEFGESGISIQFVSDVNCLSN